MLRKFELLFSINLDHDYYADGLSSDFEIVPTNSCRKILTDYSLLFKPVNDQSRGLIIYERKAEDKDDPGTILKEITKETRLTFLLKLKEPFFFNYTNLEDLRDIDKGRIFFFTNLQPNGQLDGRVDDSDGTISLTRREYASVEDALPFKSNSLRVPVNGAKHSALEVVQVGANGGEETVVFSTEIEEKQGTLLARILEIDAGSYTIKWIPRNTGDTIESETVWIDRPMGQDRVFGVIEIVLNGDNVDYSNPTNYKIRFGKLERKWRYYLILDELEDESGVMADYDIVYDMMKNENAEYYDDAIHFHQVDPNDGLETGEELNLERLAPKTVLLFKSMAEIPTLEKKLGGLKLIKVNESNISGSDDGESVVIQHLPNPPLKSSKSDIFVNL